MNASLQSDLYESERQLRAVYESALDAFLIADDDGRYLSANPAACALLGLQESELLGRRISDFVASGFDFDAAWRSFLEQGSQRGEIVLTLRDGSVRHADFNAISNVLPGRHLSILRDITDRKRAEDALKLLAEENARLYRAAEAANQAKDQFLAMLSHELRTPLTPVLALVSKLERSPAVNEDELRRTLAVIRKNVELEARLIDDLLDLTRIGRGRIELQREATLLNPLLEQAVQICCADAMAAGRIRLEVDLRAPEPRVCVDGPRLLQVFWNVLSNAVKFTPSGGTIRVTTELEGGIVVVEISDTGIGIDPVLLPSIFDAFEQGLGTARRFGGLGLGLAIAKTILDLHGGSLTARSDGPGQGATFIAKVPLDDGPEDQETKAQGEAGPGIEERKRSILLVEDHLDTAEAMAEILRGHGHRVALASSLGSALEAAAGGGIDLVISDLGLPDGSGFTLMRELKDRYGLTGIAVSGYGTEEDRRQSAAAGFSGHLTKPITIDRLLAEIRRVS
ncbi:MAG TPA: ATP-binding protein [Thermoanaerobaculia bacterium]|jgi:two-component system CheB/CheR fusion protein|nr:ATP-binding protein [Thermoanaerobaculia bacterium]